MKRCNNCFKISEDDFLFCPNCGYKEGNPPKEAYYLYPGTLLEKRYIIGEAIGFGGFGITYKAYDTKLDSVIAVKEFYPSGIASRNPGSPELFVYAKKRESEFYFFKERFIDEARNMAKFNSEQNIVNVFEFFEENNTAYISMEFLEGQGLNKYLHKNGDIVSPELAVKIAEDVANALGKLHEQGIIHRDISPDNIFMCNDGKIKLIDFGAARFARDENRQLTVILKPGFAPPEQYEQINKQGPWTDIYALGATLYYILTGQCPEESTNRKINDNLFYPHKLNPNIPEYLSNVIMKAMAIDISLRFANVREFLSALHQDKAVVPVAVEKKKRNRKRFAGIAVAVAVLVTGISVSMTEYERVKDENTLPDCTITMWYCKTGSDDNLIPGDKEKSATYKETLDNGELKAYNEIIKSFNVSYPNVTVKVEGFEEREYINKLKNSDVQPNIYEYVNSTDSKLQHLSLEKIYSSEEAKECSLLGQAGEYYGSYDYLPLGFTTPIMFARKSNDDFSDMKISSVNDIPEGHKFSTDFKGISGTMSGAGGYYDDSAFEKFSEKETDFFGTQSSNFFKVRDKMPAQYTVIPFSADKVYCKYGNIWAANDVDKNSNKAAERFLKFMLNKSSQDSIYMQSRNESFPINDNILVQYAELNYEFEGFFDNKDIYIFE